MTTPTDKTPELDSPLDEQASPPDNNTEGTAPTVESLIDELQATIAERDQLRDKWTRSVAELDNIRRRLMREMDEERRYAAIPMLKAMLPGMDGLLRAIQSAEKSGSGDSLLEGVRMVFKQFETAFTQVGMQPIEATGKSFDPNFHEAVQQMPSADHPPMTVLMDLERGYTLHDRVVRPSKVIVASPPAN